MEYRDGLRRTQQVSYSTSGGKRAWAHLREGQGVEGGEHGGLVRGLVEVFLRFGDGEQRTYPDSPSNMPVFIPLLSAAIVTITLMQKNSKQKYSP